MVRAAAADLPQVNLDDALVVCMALRDAEPECFERAALTWLAATPSNGPQALLMCGALWQIVGTQGTRVGNTGEMLRSSGREISHESPW